MAANDVRVTAVRLMAQLHSGGGSLSKLLPPAQALVSDSDKALLQVFCYGLSRWSERLQAVVDSHLSKPLKRKDHDVYLLLQLGVFQLQYTRIAPHAAVSSTVSAVKGLKKPWARALVNAVLRGVQRQADEAQPVFSESAQYSFPEWLLTQLKHDWPEQWSLIADASNQQAPMSLRVNLRHQSTEDYIARLSDVELTATHSEHTAATLVLDAPVPVQRLPGFFDGDVSVQDGAAQLAANLLQPAVEWPSGARLLDACAAPGGKTAHAIESGYWQQVLALDVDAERLVRVNETLNRLKLVDKAQVLAADAANTEQWWDGVPFQGILLDAPCSGTGVIRRHPDIKLLRRETDIAALVSTQQAILQALWATLAPKGRLLYATCSILKAENEHQISRFLAENTDAKHVVIAAEWGQKREVGRQIFPEQSGMDGFYYALLEKSD